MEKQLDQFFGHIYQLMVKFTQEGQGNVAIELKSQPTGKKTSKLSIVATNLNHRLNCIPCHKLKEYLSRSHVFASRSKAYKHFTISLLHILEKSGFGEIQLRFESRRNEVIVFRKVSISDKIVL